MDKKNIKRSPLFYVGDKYKILNQILPLFPQNISSFFEPFTGGGSVFMNVVANEYYLNDINKDLQNIHALLISHSNRKADFFKKVNNIVNKYSLSKSYVSDIIPDDLKKDFKKTYYAEFNKRGYFKLKDDYNKSKKKDPLILYLLLIYGFNRMLRFNQSGNFNLPVGNVDFNKNVVTSLKSYFEDVSTKHINLETQDFNVFLDKHKYKKNDFIYFDPPYLITFSEYNKLWSEDDEKKLLDRLDNLDKKGIKFALSNVTHYRGKKNNILIDWIKKYNVHEIKSNYISYHNNSNKQIREILITNYV
ncbi:MAG: Dam family site-specific DNA-(adenine-N6)-methyltransferase [bacterium]|nr:Dam family site-specific DNA-(adenine-N6)-methyltransferase [bacterium]